jgi:hypothetical protein
MLGPWCCGQVVGVRQAVRRWRFQNAHHFISTDMALSRYSEALYTKLKFA